MGIGLPGQRVLDLGTGNLARALARLGCKVTGVDISAEQIGQAKRLAAEEGLEAQFFVGRAEQTELPSSSFDVLTAAQSWLYFDRDQMVAEAKSATAS